MSVDYTQPRSDPSTLTLYGMAYNCSAFDANEMAIFNAQFETLAGTDDSAMREIMEDRKTTILDCFRAEKFALLEPKFTGVQGEDTELCFQLMRPNFTKSSNTVNTSWAMSISASFADWLYNTSGVGFSLPTTFGLVLVGVTSYTLPDPYIQELNFKIGRNQLIPFTTRDCRLGDNKNQVPRFPIPTLLAIPLDTFYGRWKGRAVGTEELELMGFVIGLGKGINSETPSW